MAEEHARPTTAGMTSTTWRRRVRVDAHAALAWRIKDRDDSAALAGEPWPMRNSGRDPKPKGPSAEPHGIPLFPVPNRSIKQTPSVRGEHSYNLVPGS
jgi:hypothetical protein